MFLYSERPHACRLRSWPLHQPRKPSLVTVGLRLNYNHLSSLAELNEIAVRACGVTRALADACSHFHAAARLRSWQSRVSCSGWTSPAMNLSTLTMCVARCVRACLSGTGEWRSVHGRGHNELRCAHRRDCGWSGQVLQEYPKLQNLNLHGNSIADLAEVGGRGVVSPDPEGCAADVSAPQLDKIAGLPLKKLTLHHNPVEQEPGYRNSVICRFPRLRTLDFTAVTKQDRATAETWLKLGGRQKNTRSPRASAT